MCKSFLMPLGDLLDLVHAKMRYEKKVIPNVFVAILWHRTNACFC